MSWLQWCRDKLVRLFLDPCEFDLMVAAGLMRSFPSNVTFEPALVGFGIERDGRWCYDAITYLVSTGRFQHRGLSLMHKWNRRIPYYKGFTMVDAVRRAFGLTPEQFSYLFEPSSYKVLTPDRVADRIERFAMDGLLWPPR